MRAHMLRVGSMGLDMMLRSCTVQVNLDYSDEVDIVKIQDVIGFATDRYGFVREFSV